MIFNINDRVRVRLTDSGRKSLEDDHSEFIKNNPWGIKWEYTPPVEGAEGWSTWQLWGLMSSLGPHIGLNDHSVIATTIDVDAPELDRLQAENIRLRDLLRNILPDMRARVERLQCAWPGSEMSRHIERNKALIIRIERVLDLEKHRYG